MLEKCGSRHRLTTRTSNAHFVCGGEWRPFGPEPTDSRFRSAKLACRCFGSSGKPEIPGSSCRFAVMVAPRGDGKLLSKQSPRFAEMVSGSGVWRNKICSANLAVVVELIWHVCIEH